MIPRPITIRPVLNGYVVQVGCQEVVFDSTDALISGLRHYLSDPEAIEKDYRENALHKDLINRPAAPCPDHPVGVAGIDARYR